MTRRFVFVPIFGDGVPGVGEEDWLKLPHVKAWGFVDDSIDLDEFVPIYTDPPLIALALNEPTTLFQPERAKMVDVPENSTELPDAVCIALAKLAICPVSRSNSDD